MSPVGLNWWRQQNAAGVRRCNGKMSRVNCVLRLFFFVSCQLFRRAAKSQKRSDRQSNKPDWASAWLWPYSDVKLCWTDKCFEQRVFVLKIENSVANAWCCSWHLFCKMYFRFIAMWVRARRAVNSRFSPSIITKRVHSMFIWVWRLP